MYTKKFITEGLDKNRPLIWDTETIGLYGRTRLVQVRQGEVSYEYDLFYINVEEVKYYFKDWHLVMHNSHYDLSCKDFMRWIPARLDDTMLLARLSWPGWDSHSLSSCAKELKLTDKGEEGGSDWSQLDLTTSQLEYASTDTLITEGIYNLVSDDVKNSNVYKLDIKNILLACDYQYRGMPLDLPAVKKFIKQMEKDIKNCKHLPADLNVNSHIQVKQFLGVDNSSKQFLRSLKRVEADEVITKRHCIKQIQYLTDLSKYRSALSITHPVAAKTGRFTSKSSDEIPGTFNLQQIPRELKKAFGVSTGYYITADYPALEVWVGAAVIGDRDMHRVLKNKLDLHRDTAVRMFNVKYEEVTDKDRKLAKQCNFSLLYGAGWKVLREALFNDQRYDDLDKAEELRRLWRKAYPDIVEWQEEIFRYFNTHKSRLAYTPLGRPIKAVTPMECMNFPIQGGGAECTKLAIVLLDKIGIKLCNTVHDSIALLASNDSEAKEYSEALAYAMEEAYRRTIRNCKVNDLSLSVEVNVDRSYS